MPVYLMECDCGCQWDAFFDMNAEKVGPCPECKQQGRRVFTAPYAGVDTKIDAYDIDSMVRKTGNMKGGKIGELWQMAGEASEKRGGENDPIRKKALAEYSRRRNGKKLQTDRTVDVELRVGGRTEASTTIKKV